jgi:pantoate kinase
MTAKKSTALEVSSGQLSDKLTEINDRLGALETIASLSNRQVVESYVKETLKSPQARKLMRLCEQPHTKEELKTAMKFASIQALDNHLKPLRSDDLVQQKHNDDGRLIFEWSNLFKRLPKKDRDRILA